MNASFEYTTTLEYRLKAANAQICAFKSGEIYVRMQEEYLKELRSLEREIRKLKDELSHARSETVSVRNQWFEIFEELQKECERKLSALRKELERMERRAIKAERQRDAALDKVTRQRHKIYGLEMALEEEKGRNLKLRAQINRDYENSSIPSSKTLRRKKKKAAVSRAPSRDIRDTAGKSRSLPRIRFCCRRPGKCWKIRISKRLQKRS